MRLNQHRPASPFDATEDPQPGGICRTHPGAVLPQLLEPHRDRLLRRQHETHPVPRTAQRTLSIDPMQITTPQLNLLSARVLLALIVLITLPAAGTLAQAQGAPTNCLGRSDVLGMSRIVEIDTAAGPRFGEQYEENIFLEAGEVVLTFDDGPMRRFTQPILDILDRHCVKATFFTVGRMAVADPAMLKQIDRRGHTIGTHTWSHKKLGRVGQATAKREIELGVSAIVAALGKPVAPFFRFPYLSDPKSAQKLLRNRGQGIFGIDVDSRDFSTRSGTVMAQRVLAKLKKKGKGIILFHDIQRSTARGLDGLLTKLKKRGYKVVHMVPKETVKTVARYDAIAAKYVKRKAKAKKDNPLANRAVTWPNASGAGAGSAGEVLPWTKNKSPARRSPKTAKRRKPKPAPPQTDDYEKRWQLSPFGR